MASARPYLVWSIPVTIVLMIFVSSCAFGGSSPVNAEGRDMDIQRMQDEQSLAGDGHHHIHKRAAITLPDNVTFTLNKTGSSATTTEMRVGTRVSFQLQILFPQTTTDMLVELFAPDNESIVMMLCDVTINSIGDNLQHTGPAEIVMDSQNQSSRYFDRAIIDFGNVTNDFTQKNDESYSSILITWDAVMVANDQTQHDQLYWVSAGAEYNYEMEVWVGQASFTAKTTDADPDGFDPPLLNLTGPSTMMIGSSAVFRLDMYIDSPSFTLNIDAFAPLNVSDVMSICGMRVVDAAENFQCGFNPYEHEATLYTDDNTRGYDRARLELATLTNKGAREAANVASNNRISVEFLVHLYDDVTYVGNTYTIGAAAEIGTDKIWAGLIDVTATAFNPTADIRPTWQITTDGSGTVSTVAPLKLTLDITIPQKTAGKYALEVLAPFNDSAAVFQLCSLRVVSLGSNLACTTTEPVSFYMARGDPMYTDRVYTELGIISNVGSWGWQPYNQSDPSVTEPDVLRVEFMVKATDHPLAIPGSKHAMTFGFIIDDVRLLVSTYSVTVNPPASLPNITDEMTPDWELTFVGGSENVRIGGAGQFLLTITTKRDTVYSPFDVEALMPNSSSSAPEVTLCMVQVHSVGKNLPCVVPAAINSSVAYTSSFDPALTPDQVFFDRGVVNLPSLCNQEVVNSTEEDKLVFRVGFRVHADAGLLNGTEVWPSAGVMFSPYKMWVGQIRAWARDDLTNSATPPHVEVVKTSVGAVPVGYFASYNVLVKPTPGNTVPYTVNISVSIAGLSVCSVRVVEVGANMPCTNGSTLQGLYEQDADGANIKGSIDLGVVSNVGSGAVAANSVVDENTVVLEVLIGLAGADVISDGSSHSFVVEINHDASTINSVVPPFTATHDLSSINATALNVSHVEMMVAAITETDNTSEVVAGQSKRLEVCAWTYPGLTTRLTFKLMTPVNQQGAMEVVHIRPSHGGANLPCVGACRGGTATYEPRAGSLYTDIATLDLGFVINNNADTLDPDANKVCVDGIFRVLKNDSLTIGTVLQPAGSVNVNDVEITVIQESLTVINNDTFTDIYLDNATLTSGTIISVNSTVPNPLIMTPGDVYTLPVQLSIPPYVTSLATMDIKMTLNESACMTVSDVRLISVGSNLRGFGKDYDLSCTSNSTMGTSQMDSTECSLGVITNPGMSHRCEKPEVEDDMIYMEVDFQMADCPLANNDVNLTVSLGLKVAAYIAILNFPVKVFRDGSEKPIYNLTATANSTGETMYIEYDVRLDNTSQAEVQNASLVIMAPKYVTCSTLYSSFGTNGPPAVDISSPYRMIITLGSIYLTDVVSLVVRCETNNVTVPSGISGHFTVVKHQLVGDVIPREGSALLSNTVWSCLDFVNFTATTVSDTGIACSSTELNLQDASVIYDCQISASTPTINDPTKGRKGSTGWTPYVREGELLGARYFQVYFANMMLVDRLEVGQTGSAKVTHIKLAYSNDGRAFQDGDTIPLTTEIVNVPNPKESQVLRVYLTNNDITDLPVTLTFEFYGCATTTSGPTGQTAVCAAVNSAIPPQNLDSQFFRRSFLALTTGAVFVCDGVVKKKGVVNRCFYSADGATWRPLDPRVASMVGHDQDTNRVFALSDDGVTFMSSEDQGATWASTHRDVLNLAMGGGYTAAKDVPWNDSSQLTRGNPQAIFQSNGWGADFDYLKKNEGGWKNKVKWDCC